jgi:hypothetical protein
MTQNKWNLHLDLSLISIHGICHPCGTTNASESFPIHETERFPSLLVKNIKGPSEGSADVLLCKLFRLSAVAWIMLTSHNEYSGIGPVLRGCLVRGITSSYMESGSSWVCPIKCDERTQSQWSAYEPWGGDWSTHSIPKPNNNIMSSVMDHSIHQTKHPISSLSYVHKYKILILRIYWI